jgi:electron transfer flavoprotein beta subunit
VNVVVCVKQVPDTTARKEFLADNRVNRSAVENVINPFDEYAIEEALRLKEAQGGTVTVLTMGPSSAEDSVRKALAMGADSGVVVTDPALEGSDAWATALVLSRAIARLEYDLVLTGMESTDARTGLVPAAIAEQLNLPALTYASRVEVADGTVRVNRQIAGGYQEVHATYPAIVSVVKGVNEPRYPSLKGIMAAKRKEIQKLRLADLDLGPDSAGKTGEKAKAVEVTPRPERTGGQVIKSESPEAAAQAIADFLATHKFI